MGAEGDALGEVVFNTDMTTSQDLLQDPTYSGQIVVQTYPPVSYTHLSQKCRKYVRKTRLKL